MKSTFIEALSLRLFLILIIGLNMIISPLHAANRCESLFKVAQQGMSADVKFESVPNNVIPSLYVNRLLVSRNQTVYLNGKNYIIRDWYNTKNGPVLIADTVKKRKSKLLTNKDFGNELVVVDYVRLDELMNYKNERIINRYMRDYNSNRAEAELVFTQLMKWFYMLHRYSVESFFNEKNPRHFELGMYDETQKIDDMWHTFILFTIDYSDFGSNLLGYYQHHQPFDQNVPKTPHQTAADRQRMYAFMLSTVGQNTLKEWFVDMIYSSPAVEIKNHVPVGKGLLQDARKP